MIEFIVICALAFYGSKVTWQEGMIFEYRKLLLDMWFEKHLRWDFFRKPLYACPMCMPSIWGTIAYWVRYWDSSNPLYYLMLMWVVSVFAISGLVNILMYQFPIDYD